MRRFKPPYAITGIPDSIGYLGVPMPFIIALVLLAVLTVVMQQSVVSGAIVRLAIAFDSISRRYIKREE